MTVHRTMPSEVEPEALTDLVEDCAAMPQHLRPRPRLIDLTTVPAPRLPLDFPAATIALADDFSDAYV